MDVTLVVTHRCNLGCDYCYAGEHYRRDMDDDTVDRAVDLLGGNGARVAQLGFFGGEPFLSLPAMKRAIERAQLLAAERGFRLLVQCTTNGTLIDDEAIELARSCAMKITVSIDGVKEAHDLQRPMAGGGSSFAKALAGLRRLIDAGLDPDAMMVISPQTVPHVYRSVSWLWAQGVHRVRANMLLDAAWYTTDRDDLRAELHSVACELLGRRLRSEPVSFDPFEAAIRDGGAPANANAAPRRGKRDQVAVATGGNLYPCSPMVGEDRDDGPEAMLRLGRLADGPVAIAARLRADGAGCGDGKNCACAAYLETGDRSVAGPNGVWYAAVCAEMGELVARGLRSPTRIARRPLLVGAGALIAGAAAAAFPAMLRAGLFGADAPPPRPPCAKPATLPAPAPQIDVDVPPPGALAEPPPPPAPPPDNDTIQVKGDIGPPATQPPPPDHEIIDVDGDIGPPAEHPPPPPPPPKDDEIHVRGRIAVPPPAKPKR